MYENSKDCITEDMQWVVDYSFNGFKVTVCKISPLDVRLQIAVDFVTFCPPNSSAILAMVSVRGGGKIDTV